MKKIVFLCLTMAIISSLFAQIPPNVEEMRSCLELVKQYEIRSWQEGIDWEKKHAGREQNFDSRYVRIDIEVHFNDSRP